MSAGGEFDIIARHFAPLAKGAPLAFGLKDDAALIAPPKGHSLVVTTDAIVEGVHYLPDDPPGTIAQKLLRVSLSDLAAKGATPLGYVLTCAFPKNVTNIWLAAFARGLKRDQKTFGLHLLGGDTVSTPGPAMFSATLFGAVPGKGMLRRDGARAGDIVAVTGAIGDGGLGLAELRNPHAGLSPPQRRALIARYRTPRPRTLLGPHLLGVAAAAMDVSDGLVQDLNHLATASGVRILIDLLQIPLSAAATILVRSDPMARMAAITAGDDYEIVCTVPPRRWAAAQLAACQSKTRLTQIGRVEKGAGVEVLDAQGRAVVVAAPGWDHFAR